MNLLAAFCEAAKFSVLFLAAGFSTREIGIAFCLISLVEFVQNCIWDAKYRTGEEVDGGNE